MISVFASLFLAVEAPAPPPLPAVAEGDLLFQDAPAGEGDWLKQATGAAHGHVGLVIQRQGKLVVVEALGRVRLTEPADFMARAPTDIRRPATPLTNGERVLLRGHAQGALMTRAEAVPDWNSDAYYAAELAYKVWRKVGPELCTLDRLDDPRYSALRGELPPTMPVVSMSALFGSPLFVAAPPAE